MSSNFAFKDNNENESFARPETTKRRKKADEVPPTPASLDQSNAMGAVSGRQEGSKESPINIDGDEVDPDWMRNIPKHKVTFRKGLLQSSLRNVDLSRNARGSLKEGPLFGANNTSPDQDDLKASGDPKKSPEGRGNPLFDPPLMGIEDTLTGVTTYNTNTNLLYRDFTRPRGRPPQRPKGRPPGLSSLPTTSVPWTSSTPSLNRPPQRAPGRKSPELVSAASSTCSSDDEHILNGSIDLPQLDTAFSPLKPTPAPPEPKREPEVIELGDSSDSETVVGDESIITQVRVGDGQTFTPDCTPKKAVSAEATAGDAEGIVLDKNGGSGAVNLVPGSLASDGGVPLTTTECAVELSYTTYSSNEDSDNNEDNNHKNTGGAPDDLIDQIAASLQSTSSEASSSEDEEETITILLINRENLSHQVEITIPLSLPLHSLRPKISRALGWDGAGTASMRVWAVKSSHPRWTEDEQYLIYGSTMEKVMEWMKWNQENDEDMYFLVALGQGKISWWSTEDKKINEEFREDEWNRFKVPRIFGGDRPEGWSGVNGFLLPPKIGG